MALTQRLEMRQGQALVMTPQLQQAIKLLQMSNLEVQAFVEQELERNPLLERDESAPAPTRDEGAPEPAAEAAVPDSALTLKEDAPPADASSDLDTDYDNVYSEDSACDRANGAAGDGGPSSWQDVRGGGSQNGDDAMSLEATLAKAPNLHEHLAEQLQVACTDARDRLIGAYLIDAIDECGYLTVDITAAAQHLAVPSPVVENVLKAIQKFDPTGVGARSLAECLALQLRERNRLDPAMQALLDNLELLAKRDLATLLRLTQVSHEDLVDMIAEIKQLNPKPGLKFGTEAIQPVVPDIYVKENPSGGFSVELNSDTLPRVLINTRYYATTSKGKDAKAYLTDCLNNANWLVRSLDQRARTILKVATEIVRQQDGFFVNGVTQLRPLNLRVIAEAIGMHESTVSRVTANKYLATPRGTFELKYFFTSSIASSAEGGEAHSAEAVRHHIRELIDKEVPANILSDDRIVEILRKTGIDIARRTVAKYREAMRIPSSVERRRLKQSMALPDSALAP
jgi:RNA polymerase sigma-54 factor